MVAVPPTPPILLTTAVTTDSVQLQWKQGDSGGAAVRGFILYFRKEGGEWEELILEPRMTTYLMEGLDCGTSYQFRLTGKNISYLKGFDHLIPKLKFLLFLF